MPRAARVPVETERGFSAAVIALARLHKWLVYHTRLSLGSEAGFPDLVLVRPGDVLFIELKTMTGKLTPAQQHWQDVLAQCPGVEVAIWRPSDWPVIEARLQRV